MSEWEHVVDVTKLVFPNWADDNHQYTNSFVLSNDSYDDDDKRQYYWYVIVYDGWNGKHSGGSKSYRTPLSWEVL